MHPGRAVHELGQKEGRADGASLASAAVLHVGDIALDQVFVLIEHGQFPESLAGLFPGVDGLLDQFIVVAHDSRAGFAQGGHHGSRQSRHVHQPGDALLPGVTQGVGQHQAAFGVGVDHFYRLSVHGPNYVSGTLGGRSGHVLRGRDHGQDVYLGFGLSDDLHGGDHRCAPGHITLHGLHAAGGFQRNPAGVKGDSLADEAQVVLRVGGVAVITQDDELGRFVGALGDAHERAHAHLLHLRVFQNLYLETLLFRHFLGRLRHAGRCHVIGRLVDHVTGDDGRPGHRGTQLDPGFDGLGPGFVQLNHRQFPKLGGGIFLIGQIGPKLVETQVGSLGDGLST